MQNRSDSVQQTSMMQHEVRPAMASLAQTMTAKVQGTKPHSHDTHRWTLSIRVN